MIPNKKGPGLFGSLFGMLIGLGLIILLSPFLAWQSLSQDRAKDFKTAEIVASDSVVEGYVVVEGDTESIDSLICPKVGDVLKDSSDRKEIEVEIVEEFELDLEDDDDFIFEEDEEIDDLEDLESASEDDDFIFG